MNFELLMDISKFSLKYPDLVKNTVDSISIQGGVYFENGTLKPDNLVANNNCSPHHATHFTKYIQDNNIPTTVYTKVAAFATKLYSDFFEELSANRGQQSSMDGQPKVDARRD